MADIRMHITTDLGRVHTSKKDTFSEENLNGLKKVLADFTELNSVYITTEDGVLTYFNPRHIVSVSIERL